MTQDLRFSLKITDDNNISRSFPEIFGNEPELHEMQALRERLPSFQQSHRTTVPQLRSLAIGGIHVP
jgi:hypothetical protein